MVLEQRPDEILTDVIERGLETFKSVIHGVTDVIRTGDEAVKELDSALTAGRPQPGETPQETFTGVLEMLSDALEEARETGSASALTVVQKARQILTRVNAAEPAWRARPTSVRSLSDVFRMALRDLRSSNSLIRLAQGTGTVEDLEALSKWADDLTARLKQVTGALTAPQAPIGIPAAATPEATAPTLAKGKRKKKDTTPKTAPQPDDVRFALAVAEEYGDSKVKGWAQEFADGKISEEQWISRLTTHAASTRETLDDIFERANQRIAREGNASKGPQPEEK